MKTTRLSDQQIIAILKQHESGVSVADLCPEHNIGNSTFYKWRAKYSGMDAAMIKEMKELKAENARLKRMYAEEKLKAEIAREAIGIKCSQCAESSMVNGLHE